MKENRKLLKEVLEDIRHDMTDEEVLNMLADSKISVSPQNEKEKSTLGQRAADTIAQFAGSWAFIFSFTGVLILWMIVNAVLAAKAFDPYPFILLNLVLSCVAAIQAPLIMMSQNRQYTHLLNPRPLFLSDRLPEWDFCDFLTLRFTTEPPAECDAILKMYQTGAAPAGSFTRGLYYRTLK